MYLDIVSLIRGALLESGVEESMLSEFDGYSTIALDFDNYPSLLISVIDERVWIWSNLCENTPGVLQQRLPIVMEKIMEGCNFSMTGQLQLAVNNGLIELKGMVHPDYLVSSSRFSDALEEFFHLQESYLGVMR